MAGERRSRRSEAGQHTAEFAILIGIATLAAISMQLFARRAIQTGLTYVSDTTLGDPDDCDQAFTDPDGCDPDTRDTLVALQSNADQTVTEEGTADFRRLTTITESVTGNSQHEDEILRVLPADLE